MTNPYSNFLFTNHLKNIIKILLFSGKKYFCPLCEKSASRFLSAGVNRRPNAKCPFCGALERQRLIWLFIKMKTKIGEKPPEKTLHIAPEKMLEKKLRTLINKTYLSADLLDPSTDIRMDITNIQYPDNFFDLIICNHVLEHIEDDQRAIREMKRVLTKKGLAILTVPISGARTYEDKQIQSQCDRLRAFGQEDHVRIYGSDFFLCLKKEGFKVKKISRESFLNPQQCKKMRITSASGYLFICQK
ncbi:MAG: methyltransferase domain-containing protein [Verrucomicrobia bacterium]|nr:methyltransferase domain-containing protein [Verrucomicrobiota bacterium]